MMAPETRAKLIDLVGDAMRLPAPDRAAFLHAECPDPAVEREALSLLTALEQGVAFTERPTHTPSAPLPASPTPAQDESPGGLIGRYKLLELIGEGGFGRVFMAEQREPVVRRVALKVIKLGMDTRQVVARFEAERQALAMMDHPGIATVLDGGATGSGRPYFVMELVKGAPITEHCDRASLSVPDRLALFVEVCEAVQHAHQKGVIHRDLKPSNVLVTERDGRARPKVIDFGIAKATSGRLTDSTLFTEFRQFIGTPQYMSPEQTHGAGVDIDTRADIYSLGVLLYELLTGTTPLDPESLRAADLVEMQRLIRESETPRPSTRVTGLRSAPGVAARRRTEPRRLGLLLRGDLDWIVLKALDKDRSRRYDTAAALAEDVRRFLAHEPVSATPPSAAYRVGKFVRRHRGGVIAASLVGAALLLGLAATGAGLVWALEERSRADTERTRARHEADRAGAIAAYLKRMLASASPFAANGDDTTLLRRIAGDALAGLDSGDRLDPLIDAELRHTIATVLNHTGDLERAETEMRRALKTRLDILGPADADTLDSQAGLALTLIERGRYDEAAALAEGAAEASRRTLGPRHPVTGAALDGLAQVRAKQGRLPEAESLKREQVAVLTAVHGPEHPETLIARTDLGILLHAQGKSREAEAGHREVLDVATRTLGDGHPVTLQSMNSLAVVLSEGAGRIDDALVLLRRSVRATKAAFGPDHPATINRLTNLGTVLTMADRLDEAEACQREAYEAGLRKFGPAHEMSLLPGSALATTLLRLGRADEAVALHREVVAGLRATLGTDHPDTLGAMVALAHALRTAGHAAEAEPIVDQALAGLRRVVSPTDVITVTAMRRRAMILVDLGRFAEAERQLREADDASRLERPDHRPERRAIAGHFVALYEAWDKAEPGTGYDARAVPWREQLAPVPDAGR